MTPTVLEFWLSSLDMREYHQTFLDNGYDDLEICKKIGASDLTAMGVFRPEHRARLLLAVSELSTGATQVYIRAASLHWKILREEDKRDIPTNLLRKRMRRTMRGVIRRTVRPLKGVRRRTVRSVRGERRTLRSVGGERRRTVRPALH